MDREEACGGIREVVMVVEDAKSVFRHTTKHSVASVLQTPPQLRRISPLPLFEVDHDRDSE